MHTINMIKVLLYSPVLSLLLRHPQDGFSPSINIVFYLSLVSDDWSPPCPIIGRPMSGDRYHCVTRIIHHIFTKIDQSTDTRVLGDASKLHETELQSAMVSYYLP